MATKWRFTGDFYVDGISGDDANAGTKEAPLKQLEPQQLQDLEILKRLLLELVFTMNQSPAIK